MNFQDPQSNTMPAIGATTDPWLQAKQYGYQMKIVGKI